MFFQWVMCLAIFIVGFILQCYRGSAFEPYAAVGGFLWATGNVLCVAIISTIGLGLGMLVWGIANLLTGWASAKFGFFGIAKQTVDNPTLNVIGVVVVVFSLILMYFIEPEEDCAPDSDDEFFPKNDSTVNEFPDAEYNQLRNDVRSGGLRKSKSFVAVNKNSQKSVGFPLAIIAGFFFGLCFDPAQFLIDHPDGNEHSTESLDYVFSQFCGIFVTSSFYFLAYCAYKKNKPILYPEIVLPSFISGLGWSVAQVAWFVANENLSFVISFPVITIAPGLIASMYGVFLFDEIKGTKNFIILATAFLVAASGITLIVISR